MKLDVALKFATAGECYRSIDPKKAVEMFLSAIKMFENGGNFESSIKYYVKVAEIYEKDIRNKEEAIKYYKKVVDAYKVRNSDIYTVKYREKIGCLLAEVDKFDEATETFEHVAQLQQHDACLKFSTNKTLFKALLCSLKESAVSSFIII